MRLVSLTDGETTNSTLETGQMRAPTITFTKDSLVGRYLNSFSAGCTFNEDDNSFACSGLAGSMLRSHDQEVNANEAKLLAALRAVHKYRVQNDGSLALYDTGKGIELVFAAKAEATHAP